MSVLSVCQRVALRIGLEKPTAVYASTDRTYEVLGDLANECAERIMRANDWQLLMRRATITGDGATTAFDLPGDYDRMVAKTNLWSSSLEAALTRIHDIDRWNGLETQDVDFLINSWIVYGGQLHVRPALDTGVTATYYYVSNLYANDGSANVETFDADDDTFRLDDQLLKLAMIWQWRESKGQPYAEDLANYERLLAKRIDRDRGSRTLRIGPQRLPGGVRTAYPIQLSEGS